MTKQKPTPPTTPKSLIFGRRCDYALIKKGCTYPRQPKFFKFDGDEITPPLDPDMALDLKSIGVTEGIWACDDWEPNKEKWPATKRSQIDGALINPKFCRNPMYPLARPLYNTVSGPGKALWCCSNRFEQNPPFSLECKDQLPTEQDKDGKYINLDKCYPYK